jgi:hypothetical protein
LLLIKKIKVEMNNIFSDKWDHKMELKINLKNFKYMQKT